MKYYDRYKYFRRDGFVDATVPFINVPALDTDLYVAWNSFTMRMDTLSYKYYGDANYAWLILSANPSVGGYEYKIMDGTRIRIPYPLDSAISRYESGIKAYLDER